MDGVQHTIGDSSSIATNLIISTEPKLTFLSFCFGVGVLWSWSVGSVFTFLIRIDNRTVGVDHSIHIKGADILNIRCIRICSKSCQHNITCRIYIIGED